MRTEERRRAAGLARQVCRGVVSFETFADEFGESSDVLITALFELIEHQPKRGGLLGVSEQAYVEYQADIERAIRALDGA